ncbi:acetate--CoA ligase family protein [Vulcanisaeta souniana]|uniref:CoA-binding protein n=1 Tax=Vulcanisaeta souniana JCM 11219 TaxID=1293586 RepID=A0A830E244_9CREN|nr:CoA-binding protein [Vulcanisaeta souniana]BDR92390.1 CoA-binding protein [Vulcanisaeta souniana JCM 11219]GGI75205.1 CoA-binding protein [Vulcanisaeta souniana JCM 11219]
MSVSLNYLLNPRSIAIIGATAREGSVGGVITRNLLTKFRGRVYLVNPGYNELLGHRVYRSVLEVPDEVDLAVIVTPAPTVPKIMSECVAKGVRVAVIISGGFSEVGEDGAKLEREVKEAAQGRVRILGPNCIGVYNAFNGLDTFFIPQGRMERPRAGPIALISQSGAVAAAILDWAARKGIGVGIAVNYGNKLDISEVELLEALVGNEDLRVVVMYVEGLKYPGEGRRLLEVMRQVTKVKPVIVYKAGRSKSSGRAVKSHTAALAGNYEIYRAMLRQTGAIEVNNLMDALEVAKALATQPLPRGNRVLIITDSGGAGVQAVDNVESVGLVVPELPQEVRSTLAKSLPPFVSTANPIDLTGSATDAMYKFVLDTVLPTGHIDMALVLAQMQLPGMTPKLADYVIEARRFGKPIVVYGISANEDARAFKARLEEGGVPTYERLETAANALRALYEYAVTRGLVRPR